MTDTKPTTEEREAQRLDSLFVGTWGGSRVKSKYLLEYADEHSKQLAATFLAKARELLSPAIAAQARRECIRDILVEWIEPLHLALPGFVAWLEDERDAAHPAPPAEKPQPAPTATPALGAPEPAQFATTRLIHRPLEVRGLDGTWHPAVPASQPDPVGYFGLRLADGTMLKRHRGDMGVTWRLVVRETGEPTKPNLPAARAIVAAYGPAQVRADVSLPTQPPPDYPPAKPEAPAEPQPVKVLPQTDDADARGTLLAAVSRWARSGGTAADADQLERAFDAFASAVTAGVRTERNR